MFSFNIKIYLFHQHVKYYKIHIINGSLCEQETYFPIRILVHVCAYTIIYIYVCIYTHTYAFSSIFIYDYT